MNINQRTAFARAAEENDRRIIKKAKKSKKEGSKKMAPVSCKGKNKFKY